MYVVIQNKAPPAISKYNSKFIFYIYTNVIKNVQLIHCGRKVIAQLIQIFNGCVHLDYFPKAWKTATTVMVLKPRKDTQQPINHRPISLLNPMSKVFESLFLDCLKLPTTPRPVQFRFRDQHSTTTQLVNNIDNIINNLNRRQKNSSGSTRHRKGFQYVLAQQLHLKNYQQEFLPSSPTLSEYFQTTDPST